jgi:nuclear transport factor 2 (NTF2) superfamily protein
MDVPATPGNDLAAATDLIDAWVAAWNADDPVAVAAVFTEDAFYRDNNVQRTGRPAILQYAEYYIETVLEVRRTGEGWATERGTFVFPVSFDYDFGTPGDSGTDAGEVEVELAGELLSRFDLQWQAVD